MLLVSYSITKATNGQFWCLLYKARSGFLQNLMIKSRILSVLKKVVAHPNCFVAEFPRIEPEALKLSSSNRATDPDPGCNFRRETKKRR